jgi:hypothetical protein
MLDLRATICELYRTNTSLSQLVSFNLSHEHIDAGNKEESFLISYYETICTIGP